MHVPVLKKEVLQYLDVQPGKNFIDCTINGAGHTKLILEATKPDGKVLGIEADEEIFNEVKSEISFYKKRLLVVNDNFVNLKEIVQQTGFKSIDGILFDLGFSSWHIDNSKKGFTFSENQLLDMRYSLKQENITAWQIINEWPKQDLEFIFKEYGQERFSKIIAQRIVEKRKQKTIDKTFDLVDVIEECIPGKFKNQKIHFATRVFQSLRIQVNDELENLKKVLPQTIDVLGKNARIVVISFHSLEDRIVKHFFKNNENFEILTKKPIIASDYEIKNNPRSRSAKLRAVKII